MKILNILNEMRFPVERKRAPGPKRREITDREAAIVGLWLDDPYGDGIRLDHIREPSKERLAAIEFVKSGQPDMFGGQQVYIDKGRAEAKTRSGWNRLMRQGVLNKERY